MCWSVLAVRRGRRRGRKLEEKGREREGEEEEAGEASRLLSLQGLEQSHGGTKWLDPMEAFSLGGCQPLGQPGSCALTPEVCKCHVSRRQGSSLHSGGTLGAQLRDHVWPQLQGLWGVSK